MSVLLKKSCAKGSLSAAASCSLRHAPSLSTLSSSSSFLSPSSSSSSISFSTFPFPSRPVRSPLLSSSSSSPSLLSSCSVVTPSSLYQLECRRGFAAVKTKLDPKLKAQARQDALKKGRKKKTFRRLTLTGGFDLATSVRLAKATAKHHFDESIEIAVNLGLDVRKPDQTVRSVASLPHGTGKKEMVAVFAVGAKAEEAKAAGAFIVGSQDLADQITAGKINFSKCFATPDMMPVVAKVARILGPRGLMPNPKSGTITANIGPAVKEALQGQVQFRTDKHGVVQAAVGKLSFTDVALFENIEAFVHALNAAKPSGSKGNYIRGAFISSSHGQSVQLDLKLPPFARTSSATNAVTVVKKGKEDALLHYQRLKEAVEAQQQLVQEA
eukprot:gb/GEZN01007683.1/.p1 GENE.gb/GEZN01007683.1/~~gb/GEZN01007683.1/.p1  ORF type:complete len:384 (-),score=116.28 gb/GEZN01007683.1/:304-1455(-)